MKHLVGATKPASVRVKVMGPSKGNGFIASRLLIARKGENDWIPCILYRPLTAAKATTILTADEGKVGWVSKGQPKPKDIIRQLLKNKNNVLVPDLFTQGEHTLQPGTMTRRDKNAKYFTTFNLTDTQNQIQDLLTLIRFIKQAAGLPQAVNLYASGQTGLIGLLTASVTDAFDRIVLDGHHFNPTSDQNMLKLDLPGIMRVGGLKTAVALAGKQHMLLFNTHKSLQSPNVRQVIKLEQHADYVQITKEEIDQSHIIDFLTH